MKNVHKMVKFLEELGMKWVAGPLYPDYYPGKPVGQIGRSIEGEIFDSHFSAYDAKRLVSFLD